MNKCDEGRQQTGTRLLKPLPLVVKLDVSNVTKKLNHQMAVTNTSKSVTTASTMSTCSFYC